MLIVCSKFMKCGKTMHCSWRKTIEFEHANIGEVDGSTYNKISEKGISLNCREFDECKLVPYLKVKEGLV